MINQMRRTENKWIASFMQILRSGGASTLNWAELLGWSVVARALIARFPIDQALRLLDALPSRQARDTGAVSFPSDRQVRLAGACLGRSLARSQYFRLRGVPHRIVIGVTGEVDGFRAHAWVAPFETAPEEFVELRSIDR